MPETSASPKISIIIPTLGRSRKERLDGLLSEIDKQTLADREVIVVDGKNGQGRAINEGAARARGNILLILDDDTSLGHPDLFKNMVSVLESDSSIGMVGASTIPRPNDSLFQKIAMRQVPRRYYPVVDKVTESDMAQHPCCVIPKTVFKEVGGENELLARGLDPELRFRIRAKGYKIVIAPDSWIYHPLPESVTGIFTMYFNNGKKAALAYKTNPDLIYEVGGIHQKFPSPQKTTIVYRVFRFIIRFLGNIITLKIMTLISMAGYGLGYMVGFLTYKRSGDDIIIDLYLYNIRYFFATLREVFAIFFKEILVAKNNMFKRYVTERLALYSVKKLSKKYIRKTVIWIHGNSLGDMNGAVRLSGILKADLPDTVVIASTTETAAYDIVRNNLKGVDEVFFLPFDMPFLINRVFKRLRPKLFISVEVMLWPNLVIALHKLNIRTVLLNGDGRHLDKAADRYRIPKKLRGWFLNKVDFLAVRSKEGADGLIEMGVDKEKIGITGCFRLDQPIDFPTEDEKDKLLDGLCLSKDMDIVIAGGTWPGEEEIFLKAFKEIAARYPNLVMVIAPRHMKRVNEICQLALSVNVIPRKRSLLRATKVKSGEVVVLDTLGELHKLYGIAKLSIMGSSFVEVFGSGGIHIAPLFRGSPIIIGPYTELWTDLAKEMNLARVYDHKELIDAMAHFLERPDCAFNYCRFALNIIDKYRGSFARSAEIIEKMLS